MQFDSRVKADDLDRDLRCDASIAPYALIGKDVSNGAVRRPVAIITG